MQGLSICFVIIFGLRLLNAVVIGRVRNLAGSIVAYCHSLERASGKLSEKSCRVGLVSGNDGMTETHRVHVYGATWDLCPPNYDTVTFSFAKQAWVAVKWAVGWGT